MTKQAIALLRKVKRHILANPARLRMDHWLLAKAEMWSNTIHADYGESPEINFPKCGTVACIAGWTCLLGNPRKRKPCELCDIEREARALLGLTKPGSLAVSRSLFYVPGWPAGMHENYLRARTQKARANLVARRIEQFTKERGHE